MTLVFQYQGQGVVPKPIVPIIVEGPTSFVETRALVDTGASLSVLERWIANWIGLDLSDSESIEISTATGEPFRARLGVVELSLQSDDDFCRWQSTVAFADVSLGDQILGFAGGLQHFDVTFLGRQRLVQLVWNG